MHAKVFHLIWHLANAIYSVIFKKMSYIFILICLYSTILSGSIWVQISKGNSQYNKPLCQFSIHNQHIHLNFAFRCFHYLFIGFAQFWGTLIVGKLLSIYKICVWKILEFINAYLVFKQKFTRSWLFSILVLLKFYLHFKSKTQS